MTDAAPLAVWRCPNCGRILAREAIESGVVEVKCSCNQVSTLRVGATSLDKPKMAVLE